MSTLVLVNSDDIGINDPIVGKLIQDKFTSMRVSRQRRYQLRKEAAGLCRICGDVCARKQVYCPTHLEKQRILCRKVKTDTPAATLDPRDLI